MLITAFYDDKSKDDEISSTLSQMNNDSKFIMQQMKLHKQQHDEQIREQDSKLASIV